MVVLRPQLLADAKTNLHNPHNNYSMSLIYCPECKKQISNKADKCPHCGCPNAAYNTLYASQMKPINLRFLETLLIIIQLIFGIGTLLALPYLIINIITYDNIRWEAFILCAIIVLIICVIQYLVFKNLVNIAHNVTILMESKMAEVESSQETNCTTNDEVNIKSE